MGTVRVVSSQHHASGLLLTKVTSLAAESDAISSSTLSAAHRFTFFLFPFVRMDEMQTYVTTFTCNFVLQGHLSVTAFIPIRTNVCMPGRLLKECRRHPHHCPIQFLR